MHYPGFTADVKIFRQNSRLHNEASKKYIQWLYYEDNGLFEHHRDGFLAILADKSYQDAGDLLGIIQSMRAPICGFLTASQLGFNRKASSDPITVKNYFGRLTGLRTVLSQKFCWIGWTYGNVFRSCLAMINCHMHSYPLRETDNAHVVGIRNRIVSKSAIEADKRKITKKRNTARRRQRMMSSNYRSVLDDSDFD